MRLRLPQVTLAVLAVLGLLVPADAGRAGSQNPDTMMPEASASKAKQILARMFDAMGGPAFLNARESECAGRMSQFGHNSDLTSYVQFKSYWRFPDKNRTDMGKKGNIIDLFSGGEGWTLDHDGVSEEPAASVADFQASLINNPNYIFRFRLKEEGLLYRYAGLDLIDLKPVDWVELTDREQRVYRIAVARDTNLMVRFKVTLQNEANAEPDEDVTSYSNYHPLDGVQTAMQVARTHDGRRVFQAFYESCTYHPNLASDFFTRAALEQRFQQVGSSADKKKAAKSRD